MSIYRRLLRKIIGQKKEKEKASSNNFMELYSSGYYEKVKKAGKIKEYEELLDDIDDDLWGF